MIKNEYQLQVEKIINKVFGKREIEKIERFKRGYNSVVFDVKLLNPSENVVVKIIKKEYSTEAYRKEQSVWNLLGKKYPSFPVPELYEIDTSKKIIENSFCVLERLEGEPLSDIWQQISNKQSLFYEIGRYAGMIHAIKYEEYGDLDSDLELKDSFSKWSKFQEKKVGKIIERLKKRDCVDVGFVDRQNKFWNRKRNLLDLETQPVLCWGDVGFGNILVKKLKNNKYKISGLIDFEYVNSGGAVSDIFSRVRTFESFFEYAQYIYDGHEKYLKFPEQYLELAQLYHWIASMSELSKIPSMNWHDLNEEEAEDRKKVVLKNNFDRIQKVNEYFKF